jgi:plasmid maintenance system killer protein
VPSTVGSDLAAGQVTENNGGAGAETETDRRRSGLTIYFATHKLRRVMVSEKELVKEYGTDLGRRVALRLTQLRALPNAAAGQASPQLDLHQLSTDRDEQLAVKLTGKMRLIFEVANDPIPRLPDGGLDLEAVTEIEITEVVDYH